MNNALNKDYVIEDLRGTMDASADFKLTFNVTEKHGRAVLFFKITSECEVSIIEYSDEGDSIEITIPTEIMGFLVTKIDNWAFSSDDMVPVVTLMEVNLPNTIKEIGDYAFSGCYLLKEIIIPESVIEIGEGAFSRCWNIRHLEIPKNVKLIEEGAFAGCTELRSISVDSDNPVYDSRDNCNAIIQKSNNKLMVGCPATVFPKSVTEIGSFSFAYLYWMNKFVVQDGISVIGDYSFVGCEDLLMISLPQSTISIGQGAFENCSALKSIFIPRWVKSIGLEAFNGCQRLLTISVDENNVHYDSRENCQAIIESATNILIQGCSQTRIPATVITIGPYAFSGIRGIASMIIPNTITRIEDHAFDSCRDLKWVVIPETVDYIGAGVFFACENLQKIIVSDASILQQAQVPESAEIIIVNSLFDGSELLTNAVIRPTNQWIYQLEENAQFSLNTVDQEVLDKLGVVSPIPFSSRERAFLVFDHIMKELKNYVILENERWQIDEAICEAIGGCYGDFFDFPFIKFINIYNEVNRGEIGAVDVFIDMFHSYNGVNKLDVGKSLITYNKNEAQIADLDAVHHKPKMAGDGFGFFEYCLTCNKPIIVDNTNFAIRIDGIHHKYVFGDAMEKDTFSINREQLDRWLESLYCNFGKNDFFITNLFYGQGGIEEELSTRAQNEKNKCYLIKATIGVDRNQEKEQAINVFLSVFQLFIKRLNDFVVDFVYKQQLHKIAVVASIAQVMARNMSHNIGSHVFSNLISSDILHKLSNGNIYESGSYVSNNVVDKSEVSLQLAYFNQYLKSRMDYLSEVTFGIPNMLTTKYVYCDVFKELDRVRIMLNYISGIPDFKYTLCLKHNGNIITEESDIAVTLPSDVLGSQAFYNIIENIIRNTAKHADNSKQEINTFTIEFSDIEPFPGYYCVEIDNGIKESAIGSLVNKQNERINASVLDNDNSLRNHSLGLLEMKASAAFLRQVDIAKVDSYEYHVDDKDDFTNKHDNLILLKAINKNGALGYRFFIPKPQEMLFVGSWDIQEAQRRKWSNVGIGFIDEDEFTNAMQSEKPFPHSFLVCRDGLSEKALSLLSDDNDCKSLLPLRKIMLTKEEADEMNQTLNASDKDMQALKECVWKLYMGKKGIGVDDIHFGEVVSRRYRDRRQIIFENHGTKEDHDANWGQRTNSPEFWVDNLSSYTQGKLPHFSQLSRAGDGLSKTLLTQYLDGIRPLIRLEIFEAYHNKVVAIDERIQRFANENREGSSDGKGEKIPVSALFESTNVVIPKIKLDPERFDESSVQELESFIDTEIDGGLVLVHYGILERIYKTEKSITERLNEWAKKAQRVVVTSGRGSHSLNLPKSVCFANLSSVLNAFTECRSKYLINNIINQSRRKNE